MTEALHASDRAVLRVSGPDAHDFLQGLVTNDVRRLDAGPVYAALLSPQGKYLFDFFLVASRRGRARRRQGRSRRGAGAAARHVSTARQGRDRGDRPRRGRGLRRAAGGRLRRSAASRPRLAGLRRRIRRRRSPAWRRWRRRRCRRGGSPSACRRRASSSLPEESYILEMGFERLNGVDFRKGCYVGQEVTARMKHKTELRKGLVRVRVDGPPPLAGTEIRAGGRWPARSCRWRTGPGSPICASTAPRASSPPARRGSARLPASSSRAEDLAKGLEDVGVGGGEVACREDRRRPRWCRRSRRPRAPAGCRPPCPRAGHRAPSSRRSARPRRRRGRAPPTPRRRMPAVSRRERRDLAQGPRQLAAAAEGDAGGEDHLDHLPPAGDAQPPVVEPGAGALLGHEHLVLGRVVDDARHDLALVLEADRDRPVRQAVQEVGGAVERIDDPAPRADPRP